jgi:hypothetical protein
VRMGRRAGKLLATKVLVTKVVMVVMVYQTDVLLGVGSLTACGADPGGH